MKQTLGTKKSVKNGANAYTRYFSSLVLHLLSLVITEK